MNDKLEDYSKTEFETFNATTLNWTWPDMRSQFLTCGDLPKVPLDHLRGTASLNIAQNK